jgi:hypothetical protein
MGLQRSTLFSLNFCLDIGEYLKGVATVCKMSAIVINRHLFNGFCRGVQVVAPGSVFNSRRIPLNFEMRSSILLKSGEYAGANTPDVYRTTTLRLNNLA